MELTLSDCFRALIALLLGMTYHSVMLIPLMERSSRAAKQLYVELMTVNNNDIGRIQLKFMGNEAQCTTFIKHVVAYAVDTLGISVPAAYASYASDISDLASAIVSCASPPPLPRPRRTASLNQLVKEGPLPLSQTNLAPLQILAQERAHRRALNRTHPPPEPQAQALQQQAQTQQALPQQQAQTQKDQTQALLMFREVLRQKFLRQDARKRENEHWAREIQLRLQQAGERRTQQRHMQRKAAREHHQQMQQQMQAAQAEAEAQAAQAAQAAEAEAEAQAAQAEAEAQAAQATQAEADAQAAQAAQAEAEAEAGLRFRFEVVLTSGNETWSSFRECSVSSANVRNLPAYAVTAVVGALFAAQMDSAAAERISLSIVLAEGISVGGELLRGASTTPQQPQQTPPPEAMDEDFRFSMQAFVRRGDVILSHAVCNGGFAYILQAPAAAQKLTLMALEDSKVLE